jgi:hypothetical protein
MIEPWFTAVKTFDPTCSDGWTGYIEWSGLSQLKEVISLDSSLCPSIIMPLRTEDWKHNVHEDGVIDFFHDLDYLLKRVAGMEEINVLAGVLNPWGECATAFGDARFELKGYDLIGLGMSALTNCGGYPLAFDNAELSSSGLIPDFQRASHIASALRQHYPDDHHADCDIWALWKMGTKN